MTLHVDIKKKLATFDLEVALDAGNETVGFLGESGCGKSMTLRCIAGIERPDEGRIVVNDKVYFDSAAGIDLSPQQRKTALLFQDYMLFPHMTVAENIAAGIPTDVDKATRSRIVGEYLERFSLKGFGKRYPLQLSGGQRQRVALARMMAAKPDILMLDEPFSALDAHLKSMLEQNLASLFSEFNGTILYVSHDVDEAVRFCDHIAVVESGKIMELSGGAALVAHPCSMAGLRLSGCKNVKTATKVDDHTIHCSEWDIDLKTAYPVPDDVVGFGIREFVLQRMTEPAENVFRMHVDRVSDSRFERFALLRFIDADTAADEEGSIEDKLRYLEKRANWSINLKDDHNQTLPFQGEELFVRFPADAIMLVTA